MSHESLVRNGINMNRQRYLLTEQDRFWTPLPMFHMPSILPMVCCFDTGAARLSMRRFEATGRALHPRAVRDLISPRLTVAEPLDLHEAVRKRTCYFPHPRRIHMERV